MNTLEEIKQALAEFAEKKAALVEKLRAEFPQILAPLFAKTDKIQSISWTQYTPYFNDGDTCEFGCNCGDIEVNGEYKGDIDWFDWKVNSEYYPDHKPDSSVDVSACNVVREMEEALDSVPEEFYQDLFGDHAKITVHRNGEIVVEEYEHD